MLRLDKVDGWLAPSPKSSNLLRQITAAANNLLEGGVGGINAV